MKKFILQIFLIAVSALVSWWFLLRVPPGSTPPPVAEPRGELTLTLSPVAAPPGEDAELDPAPAEPPPETKPPASEPVEEQPAPPPPESGLPHRLVNDNERAHPFVRGFRALLDSYPGERMMVGEVYILDTAKVASYYGSGDELHLAFNFPPLWARWTRLQRMSWGVPWRRSP